MKTLKVKITVISVAISLLFAGCSLLETENDDEYSGNNFWSRGNVNNAEAFSLSVYNYFRDATMNNSAFITASGDFRCAPVIAVNTATLVNNLANNRLRELVNDGSNQGDWQFRRLTNWKTFYDVVQAANILYEEVERLRGITDAEIASYRTEAVFMRNLAYFFMVRAWGDVPYYTNAYNAVSLARTDMVTVLKNCLADMQAVLDGDPDMLALPWTPLTSGRKAIRASRGSYHALMMHINMWLAGFDKNNADTYYRNTIALGDELVNRNGGVYRLLPLTQNSEIFAGTSDESIFDIVQDVGTNEIFSQVFANFSDAVSFQHRLASSPVLYYQPAFMERIFPRTEVDLRVTTWFDETIYEETVLNNRREITKFFNPASTSSVTRRLSNSGNFIVFRFADAILLYAEAAAELGGEHEQTARNMLNMVRRRAGALEKESSGKELQDDIYWERVRELIGEGHYFYDLVRTGKISDMNYAVGSFITLTHFNAGAWTWPIHEDALNNNTLMILNQYWQ